jgi:hypothetical protein
MNFKLLSIVIFVFSLIFSINSLMAQTGECLPDSMEEINVSGTVITDTLNSHVNYFLDIDGDLIGDYKLNFGPAWYEPDSSDAVRPDDGAAVEIYGYLNDCNQDSFYTIIVLEINGEFWRDVYEPSWTKLTKERNRYKNSFQNHKGFSFGWLNDSIEIVTIDGVTLIDTTTHFWHYYLDVDNDAMPDYFLNFGPPWYEPTSGLEKPSEGENVSLTGAAVEKDSISIFFVFEINGEVWIDTTGLGTQMGGGWIHSNMNQERKIMIPHDPLNHMNIHQGWNDGKPHGNMNLPDSLYCQMLQLFPQNIPYTANEKVFAGYEIGVFTKARVNLMVQKDSVGSKIKFANQVNFQFHFCNEQLENQNMNKNTVQLKFWNHEGKNWEVVDAEIDELNNLIAFESTDIPSLVILTADEATALDDSDTRIVSGFELKQNYPNPFNPSTTIGFDLNEDAKVVLSVYNVLGQKLFELVNAKYSTGSYQVVLNGEMLTSGIYFYEIKTGNQRQIKKMTLLK